jgi:hypothetical protein
MCSCVPSRHSSISAPVIFRPIVCPSYHIISYILLAYCIKIKLYPTLLSIPHTPTAILPFCLSHILLLLSYPPVYPTYSYCYLSLLSIPHTPTAILASCLSHILLMLSYSCPRFYHLTRCTVYPYYVSAAKSYCYLVSLTPVATPYCYLILLFTIYTSYRYLLLLSI